MKILVNLAVIICITINLTSCITITLPLEQKVRQVSELAGGAASEFLYDPVYFSIDYYLSKNSWPVSKDDLINHGKMQNYTLRFENFKYFSIEQCSDKRINIHFIIGKQQTDNSSKNEIKGIAGIYIEDKNRVNINSYIDKRIICSITYGNNPYSDQSKSRAEGYDVHIFFETKNGNRADNTNFIMTNYPMTRKMNSTR